MNYSIQTSCLPESSGNVISADFPLSPLQDAVLPGFKRQAISSKGIRSQPVLDRKTWGALIAKSSDFIEEALADEEEYRRRASLDHAFAKLTEAAKLIACLNEQSKSFFNVLWTYMGSPALLTDENACKTMVRILRDFAGHPNASEKDVEKYLSSISDTGLEFTWVSS